MAIVTDDAAWEAGGITRGDVLAVRGYPPAVVNGNGHEPTVLAAGSPEEVAPERTCRGCSEPLTGASKREWCSEACRQAARRRAAASSGVAERPEAARGDQRRIGTVSALQRGLRYRVASRR